MKKLKDKDSGVSKDKHTTPARKKANSMETDTQKSAGLEDDGGSITGTGNNKSGNTGGDRNRR